MSNEQSKAGKIEFTGNFQSNQAQSSPELLLKTAGTGDPNYVPSLTVRDVPSRGKCSRITGITAPRVYHLLSGIELDTFFVLDWSPVVMDIQDQYELPLNETLTIAERLGIKHPVDPKTKEFKPITTDFRIVARQSNYSYGLRAISIKPANELEILRVQEKQEIERIWWTAHDIPWCLVSDLELQKLENQAFNIGWFHDAFILDLHTNVTQWVDRVEEYLFQRLSHSDRPLNLLTSEADTAIGLPVGTSLTIARHLIATRRWIIDMSTRINPARHLKATRNPLLSGLWTR